MKVFRIVLLFALLLCLSTPCFAYQFWFTVVDANIRQLDADSYRLRVDTDWGVNSLPPGSFLPSFNRFFLNGGPGVNRYNPTQNGWLRNYPGSWESGIRGASLVQEFGYDFDAPDGLGDGPFVLSYVSQFVWYKAVDNPPPPLVFGGQESQAGTISIPTQVPEPTPIFLIGLALSGFGLFSLHRRRTLHGYARQAGPPTGPPFRP